MNSESIKESKVAPDVKDKPMRFGISSSVRQLVLERDFYRCVNCGTHKSLTIDHTHPVCKGGGNEYQNLQVLCSSCNSSKGSKGMGDWLALLKESGL